MIVGEYLLRNKRKYAGRAFQGSHWLKVIMDFPIALCVNVFLLWSPDPEHSKSNKNQQNTVICDFSFPYLSMACWFTWQRKYCPV